MHSLVLADSRKVIGQLLNDRTPPSLPFSSLERGSRGSMAGDLVDSMIEGRVVLEKVNVLEGRMRYQIEKLVRAAEDTSQGVVDGTWTLKTAEGNSAHCGLPRPSRIQTKPSKSREREHEQRPR